MGGCTEGVRFTLRRQLIGQFRKKQLSFTEYQSRLVSATCLATDAPAKYLSPTTNGTPAMKPSRTNGNAPANHVAKDKNPNIENGAPLEMTVEPPAQDRGWGEFKLRDTFDSMRAYFGGRRNPGQTTTTGGGSGIGVVRPNRPIRGF